MSTTDQATTEAAEGQTLTEYCAERQGTLFELEW